MATAFNKSDGFNNDLVTAQQAFNSGVYKVALGVGAPSAAALLISSITQPAAVNGYTAGGTTTVISINSTGSTGAITIKIFATDIVFTAAGGNLGPFRYACLYNSSNNKIVGYWDYGSDITLASTETFTVDFDGTNGILQVT
jgi:hypothetical protein